MQCKVARLKDEQLQLRQELAREREGARQLRRALELAASYFHVSADDTEAEAAWMEIVLAIRSDAGRVAEDAEEVQPPGTENATLASERLAVR